MGEHYLISLVRPYLANQFATGAHLKTTILTHQFSYADFKALYGQSAVPLFLVSESGALKVFTQNLPPVPRPNQKLIALARPVGSSLDSALVQH